MTTATTSKTRLTLSRAAVQQNIADLRAFLPQGTHIMAMVKGNGYGTGLLTTSHLFQELGIHHFGVATVQEGIALREGGIEGMILVYYCAPHEAPLAAAHHLSPTLFTDQQIEAFAPYSLPVHLYINLGLNRLGCPPDDALRLAAEIDRTKTLKLEGIMTHLPSPHVPACDEQTEKQLSQFRELLRQIDAPYRHALNSAGALRFSLPETNLVRLGAALFGFHKSEASASQLPLSPAVSLTSELVAIQHCQPGEPVGYEGRFVAKKETAIGVVPLGYHDGIPSQGRLHIQGRPAPIIALCMDFFMCDLSEIPDPQVGDSVIFFDQTHRLEAFAASTGRTAHEAIACLGPRVERVIS